MVTSSTGNIQFASLACEILKEETSQQILYYIKIYIRKNRDVIFSILAVSCFRNLQLKVKNDDSKIKVKLYE